MKKTKLIYIEWADAVRNNTWMNKNEIKDWAERTNWIIKECGWLLEETKDHIILAMGHNPKDQDSDDQYNALLKIPKPWIQRRVDLTKYL